MKTEKIRESRECVLGNGIHFRSILEPRFKTQRITIHMMVPLQKETAAANAILPFLLSRANRQYPDYTRLGQKMQELYGASLSGEVHKLGDIQILSVSATGLADEYALNGEKISEELTELICSTIFDPLLSEDGLFPEDGFFQEKRQTLESIDSELNDKQSFARKKGLALLLRGEPAALSRYGTRKDVESLTREDAVAAWKRLIETARFEVMVLGNGSPELVEETIRRRFPENRNPVVCETRVFPAGDTVREETDEMEVSQCKLIMGFRSGIGADSFKKIPALKVMSAVFGGTPHSRLFANVREKMSLCYYCSSRYDTNKGVLLVQSGVEEKNLEKAREEILRQLEDLAAGNCTEEELHFAKLSLVNGLRSVEDYLGSMESWYLSQTFHPRTLTPEESAKEMMEVTLEDIQQAAACCKLDAVYIMKGRENDE